MERRFAHDFSRVRLYSDPAAERLARVMSSDAYTVGNNIVFGAGRSTETRDGRWLLVHELTHVVQHGSLVRPYRSKASFNFGKLDDSSLTEDTFSMKRDKEAKPWISSILVEFTTKEADPRGSHYWKGHRVGSISSKSGSTRRLQLSRRWWIRRTG
jgi:hypothetical protein